MPNDIDYLEYMEMAKIEAIRTAQNYVASLDDPKLIYQSAVFSGLIKEIYNNVFSPIPHRTGRRTEDGLHISSFYGIDRIVKDNRSRTLLDIHSIEELLYAWDNIYTYLCSIYNHKRTIIKFCIMIGTTKEYIYSIANDKRNKSNSHLGDLLKIWSEQCESDLIDGVTEQNSVGSMFMLKAKYGYVETQAPLQIVTNAPTETATQIAQKYTQYIEAPKQPTDI